MATIQQNLHKGSGNKSAATAEMEVARNLKQMQRGKWQQIRSKSKGGSGLNPAKKCRVGRCHVMGGHSERGVLAVGPSLNFQQPPLAPRSAGPISQKPSRRVHTAAIISQMYTMLEGPSWAETALRRGSRGRCRLQVQKRLGSSIQGECKRPTLQKSLFWEAERPLKGVLPAASYNCTRGAGPRAPHCSLDRPSALGPIYRHCSN